MSNEEKILKMLESMQTQLAENTKAIKELKESMEVQFKITNGLIAGATNKIDDIKTQNNLLESSNAARHLEIITNINELNKDVKFIKHKLHVNEEEIFDIKDHLKLVK